jgi:hypothetical protein
MTKIRMLKNSMLSGRHLAAGEELTVNMHEARALSRAGKCVALNDDGSPKSWEEIFPPAPLPVGPLTVPLPPPGN